MSMGKRSAEQQVADEANRMALNPRLPSEKHRTAHPFRNLTKTTSDPGQNDWRV